MRYLSRLAASAGVLVFAVPSVAFAGWREWLGREPKPEETSIFDNLDSIHLVLILVLVLIIAWALRRPDNIARGIAEGFGNALGGLVGLILSSVVISGIGGVAGMIATASFTFTAFAIWFIVTMIACAAFYFLVILNS